LTVVSAPWIRTDLTRSGQVFRWVGIVVVVACIARVSVAVVSGRPVHAPATSPSSGPTLGVWRLEGTQPESGFGGYLDGGGDLNGDGFNDMVIGEPGFGSESGQLFGRVQIFLGSPSGFKDEPDQVLLGEGADTGFGTWVAILGDVNGDGYADVGISSSSVSGGPFPQGRITIHHGSSAGLSSTAQWSFNGNETVKELWYVAGAGDVNGDGFADVVLGARDPAGTPSYAGFIAVFHGSNSGLSREPSWSRHGTQAGELYGTPARGAGDVNHDGFGDLIVGTMHHDGREENDGMVEVFWGGPSGLGAMPGWVATHTPKPDPRFAAGRNQLFGVSVDGAGDVNGDGFVDLVAAGSYIPNEEENEGRAFVWYGSRNGPSAAFDWSSGSGQPQALFGNSVAGVGDINGDGFADVLIASMHMDRGELNEGLVALYHGSAQGLSRWPAWTAEGNEPLAAFGTRVVALGDVNRDGLADFAVTGSRHQKAGRLVGEIRVYFGQRGGLSGSSGWDRQTSAWQRVAHAWERAFVQAGWRLAVGVALVAASLGGASVWFLRSYRSARGQFVRLRRRVEDLAAANPGEAPEDVERWQRFTAELLRSLDPESGQAHRLADLMARTVAWAVEFASTRGFELKLEVPEPDSCPGNVDGPLGEVLMVFPRVTLANVAEHSQAGHAILRVASNAEQIVIEVSDDGCGFDPGISDELAHVKRGRLGLGALRVRVDRLGGRFEIQSERGRGTTVPASLPRLRSAPSVWLPKVGKARP